MDYSGMIAGGPAISGCWINRKTNKVIEVRDFIMDGDKMLIITTDNLQIDGDDFSNNYYQVSAENKDALELQRKIADAKPDPMFEGLEELIQETRSTSTRRSETPAALAENPVISKLFEKQPPKLSVSVDLSGIPKEAVRTLIDFLGVSVEDLADYICRKATPNKEEIERQIREYV